MGLVRLAIGNVYGVIVFALNPAAQKALAEQFRNRTVLKEYWALVRGTPLQESRCPPSRTLRDGGSPRLTGLRDTSPDSDPTPRSR